MKVEFSDQQKSPTVEIGHGQYSRKFDAKDQPFEVAGFKRKEIDEGGKETGETVIMTADEEARFLLDTGLFVKVDETPKPKTEALKSEGKIGGAPATP